MWTGSSKKSVEAGKFRNLCFLDADVDKNKAHKEVSDIPHHFSGLFCSGQMHSIGLAGIRYISTSHTLALVSLCILKHIAEFTCFIGFIPRLSQA